MGTLCPLELLEPEVQSLIMCHISCVTTLHSLIRASPRYYQVFRSQREYHLTILAMRHSEAPVNLWDTIKASNVLKPPSQHDIETFTNSFMNDDGWKAPILSPEISIPMIKLNSTVDWFIHDYARDSLSNLTRLGELMDLHQDRELVHSDLSHTEKARITRAFCRFETFRHLFSSFLEEREWYLEELRPCADFLDKYNPDEIEEIACVRDYLSRRLWFAFDQVEDNLVHGELSSALQKAAQAPEDDENHPNWFGQRGKHSHESYMEFMMCLGLTFLRDVFTADAERRAELVLGNSKEAIGVLDNTFNLVGSDGPLDPRPPDPERLLPSYHDALDEESIGWHWVLHHRGYSTPGSRLTKGLRDWGFVFWGKERMVASQIFENS